MLDDVYAKCTDRMGQGLEALRRDLGRIRTGRASLALLDGVMVDYYGVPTPLNQVAKLGVPEPTLITAQPFDPSSIGAIEKAILAADLGLNPSNDGKLIRVPIPPLTEERRRELARKVGAMVEEAKNRVRQVRREGNEQVKALEKDGSISQDDERRALEKVQKLHDDFMKKVDDLARAKEKDLTEV